ncbi:hypothetical protein Daura_15910 [Dactylosporangium aurantiacum]|uniref:Uncharacterized protein n=1 Tax=Dactylosporangium aurantiacum TaxID=35754 RepID=A0A9Q9MI48_9ACTN|nr:hypothetical protein [Dactylosporangium aurantiacum]MDG6102990.1 hypothetical protein [Dactylosporangium aurantiacum]UWZ57504.1 hypothetical protein Daura_15910 [Dactylosporangium aurantiacum]
MDGQLVAAITSLGGVALGGGLSYLVQHTAQRMSERADRQRQEQARLEGRRAERLTHLEHFVTVSAAADRVAFERPDDWTAGEPWPTLAQETMQRLWVAESMLQVLYPADVHTAARAYTRRLNSAVWQGVPSLEDLYPELDELRDAFLAAARAALD